MKRFLVVALATATVGFAGTSFAAGTDLLNLGTFNPATTGMVVGATDYDSVASYAVGDAANGISSSRHNIGNLGIHVIVQPGERQVMTNNTALLGGQAANGQPWKGGGGSEVCVFCHTPHHSVKNDVTFAGVMGTLAATSFGEAPLWNRQAKAGNTYVGYGATIGGTTVGAPGGVTLACLSCHDGVTALDNLVNGPGNYAIKSGYLASRQNFNIQEDGTIKNIIGGSRRTSIGKGQASVSAGNLTETVPVAAQTIDLSNDHPVSVLYSDGDIAGGAPDATKRASLRLRDTVISDIDLSFGLQFTDGSGVGNGPAYAAEMLANLSQNRWANKGFISDTVTIADLLRGDKVECSTCHDPHFKNLSNVDLNANDTIEQDGLFLRRVGGNAGSGVCRTCHMK